MSITGANGDGTVVIGRNQNLGGAELVINGDNFGTAIRALVQLMWKARVLAKHSIRAG